MNSTFWMAVFKFLGRPAPDFHLTGGQAHDLEGADVLIEQVKAKALLADQAYDAEARVIKRLQEKSCQPVIPPKSNRKLPCFYDTFLYQARHLIESFFAKLKQYRAIATRYDKTSRIFWRLYTSLLLSFGLTDDTPLIVQLDRNTTIMLTQQIQPIQ